jgi:REP element-mobilizing transposase RayT
MLWAMALPWAYLLTWTTYGTWLPGDARGSVDAQHNAPGSEYAPAHAMRRAANAAAMAQPPLRLDAVARRIVREAIEAHCALRGWEIAALNVRSNHVHAVLRCGETLPRDAARQLKAWATRQLRAGGVIDEGRRVWTERGSGRYLWDEGSVRAAVTYVTDGQGADLD